MEASSRGRERTFSISEVSPRDRVRNRYRSAQELDRVLPVLEGLRGLDRPLSVDTYKPAVMRAALAAGASMINDVNALQSDGALDAVSASDCAVCLMHKQGDPQTMQQDPHYDDVVAEVREFLAQRVAACEAAGVSRDRIVIDPGFGFGKRSGAQPGAAAQPALTGQPGGAGACRSLAQIHFG